MYMAVCGTKILLQSSGLNDICIKKMFIKYIFFGLIAALLVGLTFTSCKKELSCEGCGADNKAPIAKAGDDQTIVLPKDSVIMDGSSSTDADGTIKSYKWIKI